VQAAGSSLLYSEEFYEEAKRHLKPYGILQAWYPDTPSVTEQAVVRSAHNCFPYVRCFRSMGERGMHILASMQPIEQATPEQLAAAMPTAAGNDLLEWSDTSDLPAYLWLVLSREISPEEAMNPDPKVRITDDHPYNEYFLLRRWRLL
jgi:hypothetical protein